MNPISNQQVHEILSNNIENAEIHIEGDGYKYQAIIISDIFNGKNTLQRHKIIYALLKEPIAAGQLHALTLKTHTVEEWKQQSKP